MDRQNPALTRAEYWLLELVVELRYPLTCLREPGVAEHTNRSGHGLDASELAQMMTTFLGAGLIELKRGIDDSAESVLERFDAVAMAELRGESPGPGPTAREQVAGRTYYGLTPDGGAVWERFASPRWNLFVAGDKWDLPADPPAALSGIDRGMVTHTLHELSGTMFVLEEPSVAWSVVRPWKATYWRTFPEAHRVEFCATEVAAERQTQPSLARWYDWGDA
jgi:hypothetical protein